MTGLYLAAATSIAFFGMSALGQKRTHALHKQKDRVAAVSLEIRDLNFF
jgi:hypothetical protein